MRFANLSFPRKQNFSLLRFEKLGKKDLYKRRVWIWLLRVTDALILFNSLIGKIDGSVFAFPTACVVTKDLNIT